MLTSFLETFVKIVQKGFYTKMKKSLSLIFVLLFISIMAVGYWANTVAPLSAQQEEVVQQVLSRPLPELVTGKTGYAQSGDIKIWYEVKAPVTTSQPKGSVLLINGLGSSAIFWPTQIIKPLQEAGYQVIVSDHRGAGLSDWGELEYDLSDLAKDNIAVLDSLGVEKANIIGLSLGGMVGQELALNYPQRVSSLISVMSSGFSLDPEFPGYESFQSEAIKLFVRFGLIPSEENTLKMILGIYSLLKGLGEIDAQHLALATLYELRHRKGFNHQLANQQAKAIEVSGSRYERLPFLSVPTLVVHGELDPLVDIQSAKKYAALIPNSETLWLSGMGHGLVPSWTKIWMNKSLGFLDRH